MKTTYSLILFAAALMLGGCASSQPSAGEAAGDAGGESAPAADGGAMGEKTSYDGSTGSGLLMERYKSGRIAGYRE